MKTAWANRLIFISSILALGFLILDFGFNQREFVEDLFDVFYIAFGLLNLVAIRLLGFQVGANRRFLIFSRYALQGFSLILVGVAMAHFWMVEIGGVSLSPVTKLMVFVLALAGISDKLSSFGRQLHPALVFVISFILLIIGGGLLLLLPNATNGGISFVDAMFTSTSAVCVTGLVVKDTGVDFTIFGQVIILLLIQFGGLGILTFTNLFGLFFRGYGSYRNRLMLQEIINAENISNTFNTLIKIIIYTLVIEGVGALLIFYSVEGQIGNAWDRAYFAVFHSVSAFCNAGFSTLSKGLWEEGYAFNYNLHLIIAVLIISGGLGYNVAINFYRYFKNNIRKRINDLLEDPGATSIPRQVISINSRIVVLTTIALLGAGTLAYFILEYNSTLKEHTTLWGKLVTSFFGAVTPRTAGFNTVDMAALTTPTILLYLLLMWVGASPGSTGGGIKTSTFAVATMNIFQQVWGRERLVVGWKEVPQKAVQRAYAIISLSLIMIGVSTFALACFEPNMDIMLIAFECFSALGTVGLSLGITSGLTDGSKIVLILTMFIGRVGFLTLLAGMVRQFVNIRYRPYKYPEEEIFIS